MKQVVQSYRDGKLRVEEVPFPQLRAGGVLVQTAFSVISAGTERAKAETGSKSLLGKAWARPDQVRKVLDTARTQGIRQTWQRVRRELDALRPLGYSAAGIVAALGAGAEGLRVGERVAIGGGGWANHAEINVVPRRLVVPVPYGVDLADAAFACLGSVALHGVRQADLRLGESALVVGLGLVGQMTVQLLAASGVRVVAVDLKDARCELARTLGARIAVPRHAATLEDSVATFTGGLGVDAALLCADTSSDDPVALAARLVRDRGRVVVVGSVGLGIDRAAFYAREIELRFSRSYGPGRYDPDYEEGGHDYPPGYVRWTEERNMAAFLDLVAQGKVTPSKLVTHRFPLADAETAYAALVDTAGDAIGVLLEYEGAERARRHIDLADVHDAAPPDVDRERQVVAARAAREGTEAEPRAVRVGWIGPGKFAQSVLLPHIPRDRTRFVCCTSATGLSAREMMRKWRFEEALGDTAAVLHHPEVDLVCITTRHNLHGPLVAEALRAGKNVYVEKPLCLFPAELEEIARLLAAPVPRIPSPAGAMAARESPEQSANGEPPLPAAESAKSPPPKSPPPGAAPAEGRLMVGFNRRFAPATRATLDFLAREAPSAERHVSITVLAGPLPEDSWIHRMEGGGRILGEVCHFVDLATALAEAPATSVYARPLASRRWENLSVVMQHANGSLSQITYLAVGSAKLPKERVEVSAGTATVTIENFASLEVHAGLKSTRARFGAGDKGHAAEMTALFTAASTGAPMPLDPLDILHSTAATFAVIESLRSGEPIELEQ